MSDLISREQAIDALREKLAEYVPYLSRKVEEIPLECEMTIRNLPQKTGKWIVHTEIENVYGGIYIECSECGESYVVQHLDAEIFCRTCGSKNGV